VVEGVNSNMIYFIHCKNLFNSKCHNVPPPGTTIKEKIDGWICVIVGSLCERC
jgi:hypothetical protein